MAARGTSQAAHTPGQSATPASSPLRRDRPGACRLARAFDRLCGLSPDVLHHHPKGVAVKPTPKQLAYLKGLAEKSGTTFAYRATSAQASAEDQAAEGPAARQRR
jgi:hypothetical protein